MAHRIIGQPCTDCPRSVRVGYIGRDPLISSKHRRGAANSSHDCIDNTVIAIEGFIPGTKPVDVKGERLTDAQDQMRRDTCARFLTLAGQRGAVPIADPGRDDNDHQRHSYHGANDEPSNPICERLGHWLPLSHYGAALQFLREPFGRSLTKALTIDCM